MIRSAGVLAIALAVVWVADRYLITDEPTRTQLTGIKERTRDALGDATAVLDRAAAQLEPTAPKAQPAGPLARAIPAGEPKPKAASPEPEAGLAPEREVTPAREPAQSTPKPPEKPRPVPEQPRPPATQPAQSPALDAVAADTTQAPWDEVQMVEMPGPLTREEVTEVQSRLDRVMGLAAGRGS